MKQDLIRSEIASTARCFLRPLDLVRQYQRADLRPNLSEAEKNAIQEAGYDSRKILHSHDLVQSKQVFFAATGITAGALLKGVIFHGNKAETNSLILRSETGTRRVMLAEHLLEK